MTIVSKLSAVSSYTSSDLSYSARAGIVAAKRTSNSGAARKRERGRGRGRGRGKGKGGREGGREGEGKKMALITSTATNTHNAAVHTCPHLSVTSRVHE